MNNDHINTEQQPSRQVPWSLITAGLVAIAFVVFVVQNSADAQVTWLFFDTSGPLWVVIVVAAIIGAILSEAISWMARRARRRRR